MVYDLHTPATHKTGADDFKKMSHNVGSLNLSLETKSKYGNNCCHEHSQTKVFEFSIAGKHTQNILKLVFSYLSFYVLRLENLFSQCSLI